MGRDRAELMIVAHLSRHNDPERDGRDDDLWEELCTRVELIMREHRYQPIEPTRMA